MPNYVALLRGINVGGKSMVPMQGLRDLFVREGFADVSTLLQSGNVLFQSKSFRAEAVELKLEKSAAKIFGRAIDFIIRDEDAWRKIIAANPFLDEAKRDPGHLLIHCLKSAPNPKALTALKAAIIGPEYFRAGDRCLYIYYPVGVGTSKLTNELLGRKLGLPGTARNWNTVLKIAALWDGGPAHPDSP